MPSLIDHGLRLFARTGLRGAHRLVNTLRPPGAIGERERIFRSRFAGLDYEGSLVEHIDRDIFYFGAYAPGELNFLDFASKALKPSGGLNYFDIGANVGQHVLWMSQRAARVFAFEPSAAAVRQMRGNLERNGIGNVTVFPFALGEEETTARLGTGLAHNAGSRSLLWTLDAAADETVEVRRGDAVFAAEQLPAMHLLKMDVEGFEKRVLTGLSERLLRDRPVIMMELIGADTKSGFANEADLRATLYPNHRLYSIHGGAHDALEPFDWQVEELVCIPEELADRFMPLAWDGRRRS